MKRREFMTLVGGAAAWPLAARAQQQSERMRRIGVLMGFDENDPEAKGWLSGFVRGLAELGWTGGRNVRLDVRWAAGDPNRMRVLAKELVNLQPDVILSETTSSTAALERETRTIPIVFAIVGDPVSSGLVSSLRSPGGNLTGFMLWEPSLTGKWLELLTEIAPGVRRVVHMFDPDAPLIRTYQPPFEAAARSLKVQPIAAPVRSDAEIEAVITSLGREPGGGLVVQATPLIEVRRALIISLAARSKIPAAYPNSGWARDGGLLTYGPALADELHRAAPYVDRILRGAKPAELPVQLPTKFELVINLKTAKALGLEVPLLLQQRADEVIE
jgi:putative ABC transport system substrate-binding protein